MSDEEIYYYTDNEEYRAPQTVEGPSYVKSNENWALTKVGKISISVFIAVLVIIIIVVPSVLASSNSIRGKMYTSPSCTEVEHIMKAYGEITGDFVPENCATYEFFYVLDWYIGLPSSVYLRNSTLPIYLYGAKNVNIRIDGPDLSRTYSSREDTLNVELPDVVGDFVITFLDREYTIRTVDWNVENLTYVVDENGFLEIPYGVTSIAPMQFQNDRSITDVYLPSSIMEIGERAFAETSLGRLFLPYGCQILGAGIVYGTPLNLVIVPDTINTMNKNPFQYVPSLSTIIAPYGRYNNVSEFLVDRWNNMIVATTTQSRTSEIPADIAIIGPYAYSEYTDTTIVITGENVRRIEENAFEGCTGMTNFIFSTVTEFIGPYSFARTTISDIDIVTSVEIIGAGAFQNSALERITFSQDSKLSEIGDYAFEGTQLISFTIPSHVTTIGANPFKNCERILAIFSSSLMFSSDTNILYDGEISRLITYCDLEPATSFVIPGTVIEIGDSAFYGSNLNQISFESNSIIDKIGSSSFAGTSITSIDIPATTTSIGNSAFENSQLRTLNMTNNSSLVTIGDRAFYGTSLSSVTIPSNVTSVGDDAFEVGGSITIIALRGENGNSFLTAQECMPVDTSLLECNCERVCGNLGECSESTSTL